MHSSILVLVFQITLLLATSGQKLKNTGSQKENSGINYRSTNTQVHASPSLTVLKCADFTVTGNGNNAEWNKARWYNLIKIDSGGRNYESKFKILYSETGIYILFSGEDDKITTKDYKDFDPIYNGDVFEVFFHPNPKTPVYFEYEINQLNKELVLMLSRVNRQSYSWTPKYPGDENRRPIKKLVEVTGEKTEVNATIKMWIAEFYIPYSILGLLPGVPPESGTIWNANFCRLDYDSGKMIKWSWTPTIQTSFHELEKFKSIRFE